MPLHEDDSDESRDRNVEQLIKDGYERDQAVAIAYSVQRKHREHKIQSSLSEKS